MSLWHAQALHGDMSQPNREKCLKAFRAGKFVALVATDVAARGLDIPEVDLVVHYDLPNNSEAFLHRSGRTGRAGRSGTTIAMYQAKEARWFQQIIRETKVRSRRQEPVVVLGFSGSAAIYKAMRRHFRISASTASRSCVS